MLPTQEQGLVWEEGVGLGGRNPESPNLLPFLGRPSSWPGGRPLCLCAFVPSCTAAQASVVVSGGLALLPLGSLPGPGPILYCPGRWNVQFWNVSSYREPHWEKGSRPNVLGCTATCRWLCPRSFTQPDYHKLWVRLLGVQDLISWRLQDWGEKAPLWGTDSACASVECAGQPDRYKVSSRASVSSVAHPLVLFPDSSL